MSPLGPRVSRARSIVPALLLLLFAAQGLWCMSRTGSTFDECAHLVAGYSYLTAGDHRINREHPPLAKLLAAAPLLLLPSVRFSTAWPEWQISDQWTLGRRFLYRANDASRLLFWSRLPLLLIACLLGYLLHRFAAEAVSRRAAACSLLLFALSPDFLAHGMLVTTDVPVTCFAFATCYLMWRCQARLSLVRAAGVGLALGAALATKFSALLLLPLFGVAWAFRAIVPQALALRWTAKSQERLLTSRAQRALALLLATAAALLTAWFVLWAAYGFEHQYAGENPELLRDTSRVATLIRGLRPLRLLPDSYLTGLWIAHHDSQSHASFLLGKLSPLGFDYYFLISLLVKTPLPVLLLSACGAALALAHARRGALLQLSLLACAVYYFTLALDARLNIGHRHILPIYPFLFVLGGAAAASLLERTWSALCVVGLFAWLAFGTWQVAPSYLAYFNELGGGSRGGREILVDSNLDWGQDLPELKRWMDANSVRRIYLSYFGTGEPEYYGILYEALPSYRALSRPVASRLDPTVSSYIAVSATNLQQVYLAAPAVSPGFLALLDYLRQQAEPEAVLGGSIYVYRLPQLLDQTKAAAAR